VIRAYPRFADGGAPGGAAGSPNGAPAAPLADVCARRAAVYQALVFGFREPTAAYLEALAGGELVAGLREAVAWLGADAVAYEPALSALVQAGEAAAELRSAPAHRGLAVEYARLFTGPGRPAVMCYASLYLDVDERRPGRLNGAAAAFAAAAYRAEGVAPAESLGELPDHVTLELEFLFHLCRREEAAWGRDEAGEGRRLRRALDAFLREHAALWLPQFARALRATAKSGLYEALAELLEAHLVVELGGLTSGGGPPPERP
jgi:TorA maturation chaperone TorD